MFHRSSHPTMMSRYQNTLNPNSNRHHPSDKAANTSTLPPPTSSRSNCNSPPDHSTVTAVDPFYPRYHTEHWQNSTIRRDTLRPPLRRECHNYKRHRTNSLRSNCDWIRNRRKNRRRRRFRSSFVRRSSSRSRIRRVANRWIQRLIGMCRRIYRVMPTEGV